MWDLWCFRNSLSHTWPLRSLCWNVGKSSSWYRLMIAFMYYIITLVFLSYASPSYSSSRAAIISPRSVVPLASCALISSKWVSGSFWLGLVPVPSPWSCGDAWTHHSCKEICFCVLVVWMRLFLLLFCSLFLLSHCCRSTSAWLLVFRTWLMAHCLSFIERKSKVSMMVDGGGSRMTFAWLRKQYVCTWLVSPKADVAPISKNVVP